jgi:hypothetical protein
MLDRLISRFHGTHDWPSVTGSVTSVTFRSSARNVSFYDIFFSFWVEGHIYSGSYTEGVEGAYYLKPQDPVTILYNPRDPNINFNPDVDSLYIYGFKPFLIGAAILLAIIAFFVFMMARN